MVEVTRVGNMIVLEYFTKEQKRILDGKDITEDEQELHFQMVRDRDDAFLEIGRMYKLRKFTGNDPLLIEPRKFRNRNALGNPYLRM